MSVVWSVIAVGEKFTRGRDPTVPLSGGPMSIFAPQATTVETVVDCVGVYTTSGRAQTAAGVYVTANPNHRVKIKVCPLDGETAPVEEPVAGCTDCGRPLPAGAGGRCGPCQQAHFLRCRESDPELLEQLAAAAKS